LLAEHATGSVDLLDGQEFGVYVTARPRPAVLAVRKQSRRVKVRADINDALLF